LFAPARHPVANGKNESTRPELEQEKKLRAELHRRTDNLAAMLDDYRKQDNLLKRR
jgi:hypothetical protein